MPNAVHISLNVSDLSRSIDFYRRFFGEPAKLKSDYAKFVTRDPEIHLALMPVPVRIGEGALSHLGIRVETSDAVRAWRKTLVERGLPAEAEKREDCCYALQDKFWVSDPDGNRWEIYNVIEDRVDADAACTPNACCTASAVPA
jgi:catechol 2,3-dioxygenase-like lactoylglutathione lyase family enzyme